MYEYVYVFIWTIVQINSKECFEVYGNYVGIRLGRQESSILLKHVVIINTGLK